MPLTVSGFRGSAIRSAFTLARFVLLEARRSGLPIMLLAAFLAGISLAGFVSQVALTEKANLQTGVLAASFRLIAIALTVVFVVTSMVRESSDKGLELLLSMPISRTTYYMGKLAGFAACGASIAIAFSITMLLYSPPLAVAAWGASLTLEASLFAAISLFFVIALGKALPALAGIGGMYVLARLIGTIQSIAISPITEEKGLFHVLARVGVEIIAVLLPPLDKITRTDWLLYSPPSWGEFSSVAGALILYSALIVAAGLFDFHRRNL